MDRRTGEYGYWTEVEVKGGYRVTSEARKEVSGVEENWTEGCTGGNQRVGIRTLEYPTRTRRYREVVRPGTPVP